MGLITTLIGNYSRSKMEEQAQKTTEIQQRIAADRALIVSDAPDDAKQFAQADITRLLYQHGGPEGKKHAPTIGTILGTLAGTMGEMAGRPRPQQAPPPPPGPVPQMWPTPEQRQQQAIRTATEGVDVGTAKRAREREAYAKEQKAALDSGEITAEEMNRNLRTFDVTGERPTTAFEVAPKEKVYFQKPGSTTPVILYRRTDGQLEDINRKIVTPEERRDWKEIEKPTGARYYNVPGLVPGTDPDLREAAKDDPNFDPKKMYHVRSDESGNPVHWSVAAQPDRSSYGAFAQIYRAVKAKYPNKSEEDLQSLAGDVFFQQMGVRLSRTQQLEAITEGLSGVPAGPGVTLPSEKPAAGGAPQGTAEPSAGGKAGAAGAPALTPGNARLVNLYLDSLRPGASRGGGPGALGIQRGRNELQRLTGLDPVSFNAEENQYRGHSVALFEATKTGDALKRLNNQVDLFGDLMVNNAKRLNELPNEILNTPMRELQAKWGANPIVRQYLISINGLQRVYTAVTAGAAQSKAQLPVGTEEHMRTVLNPNVTLRENVAEVQQIKAESRADIQASLEQQYQIKKEQADSPFGQALGTSQPQPPPPMPPAPGESTGPPPKTGEDYIKKHGLGRGR